VPVQALADLAATDLAAAGSSAGRAWMAALPSLLHDLARQWNLTADGDQFWHGDNAVVVPVRQHGRPLALKLAWPPGQASGEADALTAWRARGIVDGVQSPYLRGSSTPDRQCQAEAGLRALPPRLH
jgi:streptomycin 6-kinase